MLLRAGQILQSAATVAHICKASFSFQKTTFSSNDFDISKNLLYPFEKEKTLEALRVLGESLSSQSFYLKNLVTLDKLSNTSSSETNRAFDKNNKKFFAVKTIYLDSTNAWKQVNLTLRQFQKGNSLLFSQKSLLYNERDRELKILIDIGRKTLNDWLHLRKERQVHWTTSNLKALLLQILKEIDTQKGLGTQCNHLNPKEMFIDESQNSLKIFDFSGFEVDPNNFKWRFFGHSTNFNAAIVSLVHIINPSITRNNPEEARKFLKRNYPKFFYEMNHIEKKARSLESWFGSRSFDDIFRDGEEANLPSTFFHCDQFEDLAANNFRSSLFTRNVTDFKDEAWGLINQGLQNYKPAVQIFNSLLEENIRRYGEIHEDVCKSYLSLAELYQAMDQGSSASDYFQKALNVSNNLSNMSPLLSAKLYNEYGKFIFDKKQYQDAYEAFEKAQKFIKGTSDEISPLFQEIEDNLNKVKYYCENISTPHTEQWKQQFDGFMKGVDSLRKGLESLGSDSINNYANHLARKIENFGERIESYGEKMERFGKGMEEFGNKANKYGDKSEDMGEKIQKRAEEATKGMKLMGSYYQNYDWKTFYKENDKHSYWSKYHNGKGYDWFPRGINWWSIISFCYSNVPQGGLISRCMRRIWKFCLKVTFKLACYVLTFFLIVVIMDEIKDRRKEQKEKRQFEKKIEQEQNSKNGDSKLKVNNEEKMKEQKQVQKENMVPVTQKLQEIKKVPVQKETAGDKMNEGRIGVVPPTTKSKEVITPVISEGPKEVVGKENNTNWLFFSLIALTSTLGLSL